MRVEHTFVPDNKRVIREKAREIGELVTTSAIFADFLEANYIRVGVVHLTGQADSATEPVRPIVEVPGVVRHDAHDDFIDSLAFCVACVPREQHYNHKSQ